MIGINVRSEKNRSYADLIVDGLKVYETRSTNSLKPYIGKRVGIVRTGEGEALAIGECTIGHPIEIGSIEFDSLRHFHMVLRGSRFDIKPYGFKFLYPILNPIRYERPKNIGLGIIARQIIED